MALYRELCMAETANPAKCAQYRNYMRLSRANLEISLENLDLLLPLTLESLQAILQGVKLIQSRGKHTLDASGSPVS